uniref:Uncharacterized protein n=1 Tax=Gossypium raimondii TaxID=29730 RepID=A0A0D2R9Y0_GOSRA|nr:hypothetical protein B456_005G060300 [Gossypium raimondii]
MTNFSYSGERRQRGDGDDIIEGRAMDGNDSVDSKQDTTDMALFVQNLLQQMQSRFQTMSDSIITKNILFVLPNYANIDFSFLLKTHVRHPYPMPTRAWAWDMILRGLSKYIIVLEKFNIYIFLFQTK